MYARKLLVLFTLLMFATLNAEAANADTPTNPAGFVIRRGTNISHWLSQDFGWASRDSWFTEKDVRFIADQGFDHVRLPVDEKELWNAEGRPLEAEFKRLLSAIDWCRKAGLRVIVDLHTLNSHHFNAANEGLKITLWTNAKEQEHLLSLWRDLSERLQHFPVDLVAYEILNEPVAEDPEQWNQVFEKCYTLIRAREPKRVLVFGGNRWQMPENLPYLKVPGGDKNIILSFHTYVPLLFTHYKANWTPLQVYTGPVRYPGPIVDKETFAKLTKNYDDNVKNQIGNAAENWGPAAFRREIEPALKTARRLGLQLYCGEFGCLPTVPRADRLAYYRDIVGVFESEGLAWANWEYKGDFGVYEWLGLPALCGKPDKELLEILAKRK